MPTNTTSINVAEERFRTALAAVMQTRTMDALFSAMETT